MDKDWLERIKRIENRSIVILMAVVPLAQTVLNDLAITFGLALGGCLELFSFYILRLLIAKIIESVRKDKLTLIIGAFVVKFFLLGIGVFFSISSLPINTIALIVGISCIPVAILIETFLPENRK